MKRIHFQVWLSARLSDGLQQIHQTFTQAHLVPWLQYLHRFPLSPNTDNMYTAGAEVLFALDILRPLHTQSSLASAALPPLQPLLSTQSASILFVLPRLLSSFVQAVLKNRGALFATGSDGGTRAVTEVRRMGIGFCGTCLELLEDVEEGEAPWEARVKLLEIVHSEKLFVGVGAEAEGEVFLMRTADGAIEALAYGGEYLLPPLLSLRNDTDGKPNYSSVQGNR